MVYLWSVLNELVVIGKGSLPTAEAARAAADQAMSGLGGYIYADVYQSIDGSTLGGKAKLLWEYTSREGMWLAG